MTPRVIARMGGRFRSRRQAGVGEASDGIREHRAQPPKFERYGKNDEGTRAAASKKIPLSVTMSPRILSILNLADRSYA